MYALTIMLQQDTATLVGLIGFCAVAAASVGVLLWWTLQQPKDEE